MQTPRLFFPGETISPRVPAGRRQRRGHGFALPDEAEGLRAGARLLCGNHQRDEEQRSRHLPIRPPVGGTGPSQGRASVAGVLVAAEVVAGSPQRAHVAAAAARVLARVRRVPEMDEGQDGCGLLDW